MSDYKIVLKPWMFPKRRGPIAAKANWIFSSECYVDGMPVTVPAPPVLTDVVQTGGSISPTDSADDFEAWAHNLHK